MRTTGVALLFALVSPALFSGERTAVAEKSVYTLYRSSAIAGGDKWRIHVATFDATGGAEYNRDNCEAAKQLFQRQEGVKVTYWCERGFYSDT
jgi:hypothetical protein